MIPHPLQSLQAPPGFGWGAAVDLHPVRLFQFQRGVGRRKSGAPHTQRPLDAGGRFTEVDPISVPGGAQPEGSRDVHGANVNKPSVTRHLARTSRSASFNSPGRFVNENGSPFRITRITGAT
jgi:hypothetical protein